MSGQINLYDPALQRKRDWFALSSVAILSAVLVIGVAAAAVLVRLNLPSLAEQAAAGESQLTAMREQVVTLGQRVANNKPDPRLEQELADTRQLLAARQEVLATLQQRMGPNAESYAEYLRGYARQSVSGLWLTGVAIDAASGGMEISGRTVDPALLPEYIQRLNKEQAFQGRAFSALKLAEGKVEPAAGAVSQGNASQGGMAKKALFHDFTLIPRRPEGADKSVTVAGGAR